MSISHPLRRPRPSTPAFAKTSTSADHEGVAGRPVGDSDSPLFWSNANLYGTIDIDMGRRLDLGLAA
ncbi:hypothetical protein GCM10009733_007020 [Nonomuraea maheshkhaliensis]|uniref:Uncharacterized protein n=1 Tax=Nonomuraea maheshkhaliensis TaxID=419590 RepID=A0ABP4QJH7_9ACTN